MIVSKFVTCITKLLNFKPFQATLINLERVPSPKRITLEENIISKEHAEKLCENFGAENVLNLSKYKIPLSKSDVCCVSKGILRRPSTCFSVPCCNLQLQAKTEKASEKLPRRSQSAHTATQTATSSKDDFRKILITIPEQIEDQTNSETNIRLLNKTKNSITKSNASEVAISKPKACPYCALSSSIPKNYACPFCAKNLKNCTCIHCPHCKRSKINSSCRRSEPNKLKFFKFDKPPNYGPTGINTPSKAVAEKHNSWLLKKMESRTSSKCKISKP